MKSYRQCLTALMAITLTAFAGLALAQDEHGQEAAGHAHEKAQVHGGSAAMTREFHFETVFTPEEIRLYVYDGKQNPVMAKHWKQGLIMGSVTVSFQDRAKDAIEVELIHGVTSVGGSEESAHQHSEHEQASADEHEQGAEPETHGASAVDLWVCPMHPDQNGTSKAVCAECGMAYAPQDYLIAKIDLSGIEAGEAKAVFKLTNLSGTRAPAAKITPMSTTKMTITMMITAPPMSTTTTHTDVGPGFTGKPTSVLEPGRNFAALLREPAQVEEFLSEPPEASWRTRA